MENIDVVLSAVIWIGTMAGMLIFRNKLLVVDWENGLKIYLEDKEYSDEER